jgi:hypothetical protein
MTAQGNRLFWALLLGAAFAVATFFALFRLPFYFPPSERLVSPSYMFGFNNSIAIFTLTTLLGLATLYCLVGGAAGCPPLLHFSNDHSVSTRALCYRSLPNSLFLAMTALYAALTLVLYLYTVRAAPGLTWESRHFLHRVKLYELYGLRPYVDFQAEYGPALMYPPVWLHSLLRPLGISRNGAYFICHFLMNAAGLWCLFYLLTSIAAPRIARALAFAVLGLAAFGPYMGLNGVVLRYSLPFASVLLGHHLLSNFPITWSWKQWLGGLGLILSLSAMNVLLSSEIAAAFTAGWLTYAGLAARRNWRLIAVSIVGLLMTAIICRFTLPDGYYESLLRFSEGANNLPLLPAWHLLLYVLTLVLIVPPLLAAGWRDATPDAPLLGALGTMCVAMMPGALARCDPPHVMFFGLGASLLLMARLANWSHSAFIAYVSAYALIFIGIVSVVIMNVFFGVSGWQLVLQPSGTLNKLAAHLQKDIAQRDLSYLSALDKYPQIGLPFATQGVDKDTEDYLFAQHKLAPEYFVGFVGVYSQADTDRKLHDVARHEYLLVREGWHSPEDVMDRCEGYLNSIRQWFEYPARLPCKNVDLDSWGEVSRFIADNYDVVERVGSNLVLRRMAARTGR